MNTQMSRYVVKLMIAGLAVVALSHYARAELYECTNNEGIVTHHSKVPCPEGYTSERIEEVQPADTGTKAYKTRQAAPKNGNVEVISRGRLIDLVDHIEYGKYTVFMFYAEWCAPCKTIKPALEKHARNLNTFALKEIDVLNWENPLVRYYNLIGLPYYIVYGPEGKFVERGPVLSGELRKQITKTD